MKRGTRGMGRVFQRGNIWWVAYCHNGAERRESSESTKRPAAVTLLQLRQQQARAGRPHEEAARVRLADLRLLIEADYRINERRSSRRLGQSWARLAEHFGENEKAVAITAPRLAGYVTARTAAGAARGTVRNELAALKRAFTLARKSGALLPQEGPAAFPTITPSKPRPGFFEREEHEAVRAALPPDEGDVAEFLYWTGWRKGEALGLLWSNVDRRAQVIRIETSKSGEPRTLPYGALPPLRDLIEARRTLTDGVQQKRGMVVTHVFHRNGEPIHYFRRSWIRACVAAGLGRETQDPSGRVVERRAYRIPHDYRRSAARNLSRAGVPEQVIMALCGWATRSVFDRYRIVAERDLADGLAKLATAAKRPAPRAKVTRMRGR